MNYASLLNSEHNGAYLTPKLFQITIMEENQHVGKEFDPPRTLGHNLSPKHINLAIITIITLKVDDIHSDFSRSA